MMRPAWIALRLTVGGLVRDGLPAAGAKWYVVDQAAPGAAGFEPGDRGEALQNRFIAPADTANRLLCAGARLRGSHPGSS